MWRVARYGKPTVDPLFSADETTEYFSKTPNPSSKDLVLYTLSKDQTQESE